MQSRASAIWKGGLKDGRGTYSASSGVFQEIPYTFAQRFEGQPGSSPEELIAAAHAACFAMATSAELGGRGLTPESLEAKCTISFEKVDGRFTVTESHLDLAAKVPNADSAKFDEAVKAAETGCPISRLLKTKITVTAKLL